MRETRAAVRNHLACWALAVLPAVGAIPVDVSRVQPGPVHADLVGETLRVTWQDEAGHPWSADFGTNPKAPVLQSVQTGGKRILENAQPVYFIETGVRRGGWDQFFDLPPAHPDGTRRNQQDFQPSGVSARTVGNRIEVEYSGLVVGTFSGTLVYTFYPGTRLILQEARLATNAPDVAYFYDAGVDYQPAADRRPGNNMETWTSWFEPASPDVHTGRIPVASERDPLAVRYRTIAAKTPSGSVAVFPPPHQYFFARDYTSNMGYAWRRAWRGHVGLGVRQLPDDNSPYYPWMNAPPGTVQHMGLFLMLSDGAPPALLSDAIALTRRDHFIPLPGFKTVAPHWHFAFTEQAIAAGPKWTPPWKPVLKEIGVDAAIIMDFHGDLHPQDPGPVRFKELQKYYEMAQAHSSPDFLVIPSEEADVYFGGHWALTFPKPVMWAMKRESGDWKSTDPDFGTVYKVRDADDLLRLVREEKAFVYETHPRTKGSTGFPEKILETSWFRDTQYFGTGWKAMPSDLSSPRLGERGFKVHDDLANLGLRKKLFGEVDVFQLDDTHELYAHMNINYVRLAELPHWNNYSKVLDALAKGDGFVTTGEILLPGVRWTPSAKGVRVVADAQWTFPLKMAEIVWGDGNETHRKTIDLGTTGLFGIKRFDWTLDEPSWKWARLAVWDVAGDGAFTNAIWK